MAGYNLDDKGGLFGAFGGVKSPSKIMKSGDNVDFKHYSMFNFIKADVLEVTDSTIKVQSKENTSDKTFSPNDPIVINFTSGELYVISGDIATVHNSNPLEFTIKVAKIEKMKDLKKSEKFYVSIGGNIKAIGVSETVPAYAKHISISSIKFNCKLDIMMEDIIDVNMVLDKNSKINCKGVVVRKNKLGDIFEYGVEFCEVPESSSKNLHHLINQFIFS